MKRFYAHREQGGFGLVETLAGLVVFVLLAMVGTKAYRGVVANHKGSAQVKALTDAVARTTEALSGLTLAALAGEGSAYLRWSEPKIVGDGPDHYRYRIVPRPSVGGAPDTNLVGLEVEAGPLEGDAIKAERTFATLLSPNSGRSGLGQVSTQAERDAEAAFYQGHKAIKAALTEAVVDENQAKLNTFSCYNKGECCGFMQEYFANPAIRPADGLKEKCMYRCALAGDVTMADWKGACGVDFCSSAPWKTKEDCCRAISSGECGPGSVCSRVCLECVGENGSGCEEPVCDGGWWNDLFDCSKNQLCNGDPLPEGEIPNWGNVREICQIPACKSMGADCGISQWVCCKDYWEPLSRGETPNPKLELCAQISSQKACCEDENRRGHWDISCRADGTSDGARYNNRWYCGKEIFTDGGAGKWCSMYKVCNEPTNYKEPPGPDCPAWDRVMMNDPWQDPDPKPEPPRPPQTDEPKHEDKKKEESKKGGLLEELLNRLREASKRDGGGWGNNGGRE